MVTPQYDVNHKGNVNFMKALGFLISALLLVACAAPGPNARAEDPYEVHNREVHAANKALDQAFSGAGSDRDIPPAIGDAVVNFADNVSLPGMVVNNLLQADFVGAASNTARFLLNSTLGLGGLFDPADDVGLFEDEADFAQTLAVWGVGEGAYLELPVFGPQTQRDMVGRVVDTVIDPFGQYAADDLRWAARIANIAARAIKRGQYGDTIESVLYDSADSYEQQRLIYLQNRRFELGVTNTDDAVDPYADLYGSE